MIARLKLFSERIFTWYRLLSYFLFMVTIFILVFLIGRLDRGIQIGSLRQIFLLAALFGLLLSLIKKNMPLLKFFLSLSGSGIIAFTIIGNLFQPFIAYLRFGIQYLIALGQSGFAREEIGLELLQVQSQWNILVEGIQVLFDRLIVWLVTLPEAAYDPVSLNLTWGIIIWLTTIWVYWLVIRNKQVVIGFLPPLIIIASVNPSIESGLVWLFIVLGIGLLLLVLSDQAKLEDYWHKNKFSSSELIRRRTVQYALYLSGSLVLFAGLITSPQLDDFIDDLRDPTTQGEGSRSRPGSPLPEEESMIGPEDVLNRTADGWFPNDHLIGSGPDLAEIEVFYAEVEEPDGGVATDYYFRSATYETFTLRGWRNIDKDFSLIPPEEEFEIDFTPNEQLISQEVTLLRDFPKGNLMYVVGELAASDVPYYGSYHTKFVNNTYTDLFASVTELTEYLAYSKTPISTEIDLRNTNQDYPAWIANKYLQLPDFVPDRVYDLAYSLTATEPTPYDRALAIENYLRKYEYSLEIEEPPVYQDIVDYFLFDLQKGYCDYYASSMVVLARAAGIPARLATGYHAQTFDPEAGHFVVTANQAHSWAEVYFPEYGWVTFEPTAGQPAILRDEERQMIPESLAEGIVADDDQPQELNENIDSQVSLVPRNLFILTAELIILAVLGFAVFHWIDRRLLLRMDPKLMFSKVYERLFRQSKRIGVKVKNTDTPLELSDVLTEGMADLGKQQLMRLLLKSAPQQAAFIIAACNQAAFTNVKVDDEKIQRVIQYSGELRWRFILMQFLISLQPIQATMKRIWFRLQQPA